MGFASLEHFGLSAWRLACVGLASASAAWFLANLILGGALGQGKPAVLLVVSALVFYLVVSIPRRRLDRLRVSEAREAVLVSASAQACLGVTSSRARTLMMLRPRGSSLARAVGSASKMVLLGTKVEAALSSASQGLASDTAAETLTNLALLSPDGFESGDEEVRGLANSDDLRVETRIPMFMTACFFAPIMTLLYAVFSRTYDPLGMSELTAFVFIILDLAFYLGSADRGQG